MKHPLSVIITWDDAADRYHETCTWEWSFETLRRVPETVKPYLGRQSVGYLGFVDESWVYIASDWDAADKELGKWAVIPLGWVSSIRTAKGRVLYERR